MIFGLLNFVDSLLLLATSAVLQSYGPSAHFSTHVLSLAGHTGHTTIPIALDVSPSLGASNPTSHS